MKNFAAIFIMLVLVLGISVPAFARVDGKKAELEKVRAYLNLLDSKIEKAKTAGNNSKVSELKIEKSNQLQRAKILKEEISRVAAASTGRGWQIAGGYAGGGGILEIEYVIPMRKNFNLLFGGGFGLGNQYSIFLGKLTGVINNFWGIELGMANYSATVTGVLGVPGNISQGSSTGFGIFVKPAVGVFNTRIGYNTALGLTASIIRKF